MQNRTIGNMLEELRNKYEISRIDLCEGICAQKTLNRLESGDAMPDVLIIDRLIQRLGKSPDMFEVVLSDKEYDGMIARDEIEEVVNLGELDKAEKMLEDYSKAFEEPKNIQKQYYHQVSAVLERARGNHVKSVSHLKEALKWTRTDAIIGPESRILLCVREIELMIMLADESFRVGNNEEGQALLKFLLDYVETKYTDIGELVKVYPKLVYLFVTNNKKKEVRSKNIERCEKAFDYMIEEGTTIFLPEIMKLLIELYSEISLEKKVTQLRKQLASLEEVYEEAGFELYASKQNMGWFRESLRRDYYLCSEIVKGQRMALGLSQEELSEGIYENSVNISRVELGNAMPSYKKFNQLMEKLGLNLERYNGYLATDDYNVLEARKKINILFSRKEWEDAKIELEKLHDILDMVNPINRQYFETTDVYVDYKLGLINEVQFYERTLEALQITYVINKDRLFRIPMKQEVNILNQLAISLMVQKKEEQGIALYRHLEEKFENGKVKMKHQLRRRDAILANYTKALEEAGDIEEAIVMCRKGMELLDWAGIGSTMDVYIAEQMCITDQKKMNKDKKKKAMIKYLTQAFYFSDMFKNSDNKSACIACYRNITGEDNKWY